MRSHRTPPVLPSKKTGQVVAKQSRLRARSPPGSRKAWSISTHLASSRKEGLIGADARIDGEVIRETIKKDPTIKLNTTISIITKEIRAETVTTRVSRTRTRTSSSSTKESRTTTVTREAPNHLKINTTMANSNKCAISPKELIKMATDGNKIARLTSTTSTSNIMRIRATRICTSNASSESSTSKSATTTTTGVDKQITGTTGNRGNGTITLLKTNTPTKTPIMTSREHRMTAA